MGKELSEMTLEELWELFPIFLIAPDEKWVGYYDEIASFLQKALNDCSIERINPQIAKEHETLKLGLWKKYEHNRDAYTDAKTGFICKWTAEARKLYGDRY